MRERPRILGVIASAVPGGAEAMFASLLDGLRDRFDCYVVCDSNGTMVQRYHESARDLVAVPLDTPLRWGACRTIAQAASRWSIDLIHTHLWNADLFGSMAGALSGVPVVSTVHGSNFLPWGSTGLHRARRRLLSLGYRSVYRLCDVVIAPSLAIKQDLANRPGVRVRAEHVRLVPNGLDTLATRQRAASASVSEVPGDRLTAPLVVCVGNLFAIKGHEWLLRAWPSVVATCPTASLLLIGDGPLREPLQHLSRSLGVTDSVIFTGALSNPLGLVHRADAVVLPSLSEGLPVSLLEAMALNRPIVASRAGGIEELIVHEQHGLLVPPADPTALSRSLLRVLLDKELAGQLATRGRLRVEQHWSARRMIDLTASVYDRILSARQPLRKPA